MRKEMIDKDKLENILFKIVEYGVYLALFSPLIVVKDYFFPFVSPKTIFFRIIVDVIFIAYVLLAISNPKYRPKITPLSVAVAVFMVVLFLTSFFGLNFARSFWSVFERMTGLLTFLHLFAFFVVLENCFTEKKYWERILSVSVFVAVLISLYALFSKDVITRGGGTLGNSSFLASYLIFNIFFAVILFFWKSGFWKVIYGLALLLFLFLLFFNPHAFTKGVVSSFLIGAVLFATGLLFFSQNKLLKRIAPVFLILMVLLGILIVKNYHFQDRSFNLLAIPDRSRQLVWGLAFKAWQEKPWLGWGWENFNVPFAKYYNPAVPATGDAWYDRVHNIVLDMAVTGGIVGLLSYLSIFVVAIFALAKWAKTVLAKAQKKELSSFFGSLAPVIVPLSLITLLIVYFLQNLWVFDMISSYIMFFLALAFIDFWVNQKEEKTSLKQVPLSVFAGGLLIALTIFALFYGNIQPARTSKEIIRGIALEAEQSVQAFQKALRLSPMAQFEAPERFSSRLSDLTTQPNQNPELVISGFQSAEEEFKKAILKNPKDIRLLMFLGRHYNSFYQITGDAEKLARAEEVLKRAIELSPGNQQLYWALAQTKLYQGAFEEALLVAENALQLEPRLLESHLIAIQVAKFAGKEELAQKKIKEALEVEPNWEPQIKAILEPLEKKETH